VTDDDSFIRRYKALTGILIPSAENIFGRTARFKKNHAVTSPKIQAIVSLIRNLGGAVRHVKSDFSAPMSFKSQKTFNRYAAEFSLSSPSSSVSLHQYLVAAR
jgi:signal recognition particle subunit SEC65